MVDKFFSEPANFEDKGQRFLVRCPECHAENYALAVIDGICCWCGYDANKKETINE